MSRISYSNPFRHYTPSVSTFKVTPREIVFSLFIIGILYTIGFFIAGAIDKYVNDKNLRYRQAIQIRDNGDELKLAVDTDVGYAFVEGDFKTVDPVTWDGLDGEHLSIVRDKERYTRHTRTVHYTDSKGKSKTRTESYWTWDCVASDRIIANRITLCGEEFPTSTFYYGGIGTQRKVKHTGYHTRNVYYYQPKNFRGVFFGELKDGTIQGKPDIREGLSIERYYKYCTASHAVMWFWILWWILIALAVFGFVYIDNEWIEEDKKR